MATRDIDRGWESIKRRVFGLRGASVVAGLVAGQGGDKAHEESDLTIAEIGIVHEFGSRKAHIPERSWMRSTEAERRRVWFKLVEEGLGEMLTPKGPTIEQLLTPVGLIMESDLKRKITSLQTPPLAESTKRRKGSSNPLIDTGAMRNSVTWEIRR